VAAIQSLRPVISALVLEAQLETNLSGKNVIKKIANRIFDALMEVPARYLCGVQGDLFVAGSFAGYGASCPNRVPFFEAKSEPD
jgi:hypothetical protein